MRGDYVNRLFACPTGRQKAIAGARAGTLASAQKSGARLMPFHRMPVGLLVLSLLAMALPAVVATAQQEAAQGRASYTVQPGDRLAVSVWNEPELQQELLVAPDGGIAFPLVGTMSVVGKTTVELGQEIAERLSRYIAEPLVTVTISEVLGNKIYVLGQVNLPGEFVVNPSIDVMQALSMARGTTAFASLNDVVILRRRGSQQIAIPFRYGDVSSGRDLEQNIMLESGDVVVVP